MRKIVGYTVAAAVLVAGALIPFAPADTACGRVVCLSNKAASALGTCSGSSRGFFQYNTTTNQPVYCDGTTWQSVSAYTPAATLAMSAGGTGANLDPSAGKVVYSGSSTLALTNIGTVGQVLQSNGTGAPTWVDAAAAGGTAAPVDVYVSPSGSDSASCLSAGAPCLTQDAALGKVPSNIRNSVVVHLADGTYTTGMHIDGHVFNSGYAPLTGAYIKVLGNLIAATGLAGDMSGGVASATPGSSATWGTLTKSGAANWTDDQLRGYMLCITSGPGAWGVTNKTRTDFTCVQIKSNTSSVATITGPWATTPTGSSNYAIKMPGAIFSANTTQPGTPHSASVGAGAAVYVNTSGFSTTGDQPVGEQTPVVLENIKFTNSGDGIWVQGPYPVGIYYSQFNGVRNAVIGTRDASAIMVGSSGTNFDAASTHAGAFALESTAMDVGSFGNVFWKSGNGFLRLMRLRNAGRLAVSYTYVLGPGSNALEACSVGWGQLDGNIFDNTGGGAGTAGINIGRAGSRCGSSPTAGPSGGFGALDISASTISSFNSGIALGTGMHGLDPDGTAGITGSNTTYGIVLENGGTFEVQANTAITGLTAALYLGANNAWSYAELRQKLPYIIRSLGSQSAVWQGAINGGASVNMYHDILTPWAYSFSTALPPTGCGSDGQSRGGIWYNTTNNELAFCNNAVNRPIGGSIPAFLPSVAPAAAITAGSTIGGFVMPARSVFVNAISFRIAAAGAGGTTNANIRINGGGNCDCTFACNSAANTSYRVTCTGSPCTITANSSVTYEVISIGNCATGPTILDLAPEALWGN